MAATTRLFVGGLPADITAADLVARFRPFGKVLSVDVRPEKEPNGAGSRCRGFAFLDLEPADDKAMARCLASYNHAKWRGHMLRVAPARPCFLRRVQEEIRADELQQAAEKRDAAPTATGRAAARPALRPAVRSGSPVAVERFLPRGDGPGNAGLAGDSDGDSDGDGGADSDASSFDEAVFLARERRRVALAGAPPAHVVEAIRGVARREREREIEAGDWELPGKAAMASRAPAQPAHAGSKESAESDSQSVSSGEGGHEAWARHLGLEALMGDGGGGAKASGRGRGKRRGRGGGGEMDAVLAAFLSKAGPQERTFSARELPRVGGAEESGSERPWVARKRPKAPSGKRAKFFTLE